MRHIVLLTICVVLVAGFLLAGCGGSDEDATAVKTMEEYRDNAAKEIDKDNAEAELEKLTKEIDADNIAPEN